MKKIVVSLFLTFTVVVFADSTIPLNEGVSNTGFLTSLEKKVVIEQNLARTNPKKYATFLEQRKNFYSGRYIKIPGRITIRTREGVRAVNEAIAFLKRQSALEPLKLSKGMSRAAKDYVKVQGPRGLLGHFSGGTRPSTRVNRYGRWRRTVGENIDYGWDNARDVIMALIIDDGVRSRGHRKNIFKSRYTVVGVGCGKHRRYRHMCVLDYAGAYVEGR